MHFKINPVFQLRNFAILFYKWGDFSDFLWGHSFLLRSNEMSFFWRVENIHVALIRWEELSKIYFNSVMFDHLFRNSSKFVNFFVTGLVKLELIGELILNDECLICCSLSDLLQFLNPRVSIGLTLPELPWVLTSGTLSNPLLGFCCLYIRRNMK